MSCKLANNMTVVKSTVWIRSYRFLDARHFALFDARRHKRNHQEASAERQEDQTTQLKISLQLLSVPCWFNSNGRVGSTAMSRLISIRWCGAGKKAENCVSKYLTFRQKFLEFHGKTSKHIRAVIVCWLSFIIIRYNKYNKTSTANCMFAEIHHKTVVSHSGERQLIAR